MDKNFNDFVNDVIKDSKVIKETSKYKLYLRNTEELYTLTNHDNEYLYGTDVYDEMMEVIDNMNKGE